MADQIATFRSACCRSSVRLDLEASCTLEAGRRLVHRRLRGDRARGFRQWISKERQDYVDTYKRHQRFAFDSSDIK